MISQKDYLGDYKGPLEFHYIDDPRKLKRTGTEIQAATMKDSTGKVLGSAKRMELGSTRLKDLGVDVVEIRKLKGAKEAYVKFGQHVNGRTPIIGFLQKSDNNQMKAFINILKDLKAKGIKVDFAAIRETLKYIK